MSAYRSSSIYSGRKKSRKGLKIFLGIVIAIVVILGVLFAVNYKTIMLSLGKGSADINKPASIKTSLAASPKFSGVTGSKDSSGNTVFSSKSKNGAVSYTVTQQKNGKESVVAKINLKALKSEGISKSSILSGNISAINHAKSVADGYLSPVIDKSQVSGMEVYLAKELISQGRTNPNNINVSHTFGGLTVKVAGSLSAGTADVTFSK